MYRLTMCRLLSLLESAKSKQLKVHLNEVFLRMSAVETNNVLKEIKTNCLAHYYSTIY